MKTQCPELEEFIDTLRDSASEDGDDKTIISFETPHSDDPIYLYGVKAITAGFDDYHDKLLMENGADIVLQIRLGELNDGEKWEEYETKTKLEQLEAILDKHGVSSNPELYGELANLIG